MQSLTEFIDNNPHPKELKRALAIKMVLQEYKHQEIQKIYRSFFRIAIYHTVLISEEKSVIISLRAIFYQAPKAAKVQQRK